MKVRIQKSQDHSAFILIPEFTAKSLIDAGNRRVICQVNNSFQFHCAIQRSKVEGFYIGMGKKILKNANLALGQEIDITLSPDTTKYQSEISEELEEVLKSDFEGNEKFQALTPGKQRSIIYLVTAVKSTEKRIERALKIIENIKIGVTNNRDLLK